MVTEGRFVAVRQPKEIVEQRKLAASDLWAALEETSPEIAAIMHQQSAELSNFQPLANYPGMRHWLLVEFALNTAPAIILEKNKAMRESQIQAGVEKPWMLLSRSQVVALRRDMSREWQEVRHRIERQIEQVGVINKQSRLLAYQALVEELGDRMWEERNEKTGELYLQKDYLAAMKAVGEEMGDLGAPVDTEREGLLEIAKLLAETIKVQGSGIIEQHTEGKVFDYEDGEWVAEESDA